MSHLNWKIHYSLADSHKRYLVLKYKRWHGCKLFFWDSGNPTWHWGKRRGTSSVWRNVNVQLNLFPCLSDLKHTDNVWSGFVLTSWRGQAVRRGGIASLCCTWLGTKAIHWSILMHLPSEDQLRNAPSVSALTRRLRVTGDFKGLLLFWNQIEMPFRSINPPASAVALQIGGESVFLSQIWQQIITLNGSTEHIHHIPRCGLVTQHDYVRNEICHHLSVACVASLWRGVSESFLQICPWACFSSPLTG